MNNLIELPESPPSEFREACEEVEAWEAAEAIVYDLWDDDPLNQLLLSVLMYIQWRPRKADGLLD